MANLPDERTRYRVYWIRRGDDMYAAFVIDGSKYPDSDSVLAAAHEAREELDRRRIPAEVRISDVRPSLPNRGLPSWQEYRETLTANDTKVDK